MLKYKQKEILNESIKLLTLMDKVDNKLIERAKYLLDDSIYNYNVSDNEEEKDIFINNMVYCKKCYDSYLN